LIKKIDHIGIAVQNLEVAIEAYKALGFEVEEIEEVKEQMVRVAMLPAGESRIELLEATSDESAIAKFIEKRGEGIHHIAINVESIEDAIEKAKKAGMKLIDEKPRRGAGGKLVAFVHPKSTHGVLLEFVEG
jgi:methylmalonyl-CoA/ethylmalonyl-CoA epimerase